MSSFSFLGLGVHPADLDHSLITDLEILTHGDSQLLISSTLYDGVLLSWDITNLGNGPLDDLPFEGGVMAGDDVGIVQISTGNSMSVLMGGGADGDLQIVTMEDDGTFAPPTLLTTLPNSLSSFQAMAAITLPSGEQTVYGIVPGEDTITRVNFSAVGVFTSFATTPASGQIAAIATVQIDDAQHIITGDDASQAVTIWSIDAAGDLTERDILNNDNGLWITSPTALETVQIGDRTYVIVGAAGSNSLSVIEIGANGSMTIRDHILDTRDTRFAGVTDIDVATYNGQTFVFAGGADDGISAFLLLHDGLLVPRAHLADTTEMSLDNISAIAASAGDSGIDVFAASSSETGITQLRFETDVAGRVLSATSSSGVLQGTNGDDILRDGTGTDTLTGGDGADVFFLIADGQTDEITDFRVGEDTLDLGLWPLLRDISQLTISIKPYGMEITYGDEVLIVRSADGEPIDYRLLETADVISVTRIPQEIEPGFPGPATPNPVLVPEEVTDPIGDQTLPNSILPMLQAMAGAGLGDVRNGLLPAAGQAATPDMVQAGNSVTGGNNVDVLITGPRADGAAGGADADLLIGRAGNDDLSGGDGSDIIMGGAGADILSGGRGQDLLDGGNGNDELKGGLGNDIMLGGAGADTFVFVGGEDEIVDFVQGEDRIRFDPVLWTGLTSAADVLTVYGEIEGETVIIDFEDGNVLQINGVTDFASLNLDIDLF